MPYRAKGCIVHTECTSLTLVHSSSTSPAGAHQSVCLPYGVYGLLNLAQFGWNNFCNINCFVRFFDVFGHVTPNSKPPHYRVVVLRYMQKGTAIVPQHHNGRRAEKLHSTLVLSKSTEQNTYNLLFSGTRTPVYLMCSLLLCPMCTILGAR